MNEKKTKNWVNKWKEQEENEQTNNSSSADYRMIYVWKIKKQTKSL